MLIVRADRSENKLKVLGVIPARLQSTRLPEKLLRMIDGKYIIQYVWERAMLVNGLDKVIVAADDKKIIDAVQSFGGEAVLTRVDHKSGTDRVLEVAAESGCDVIVNIQGDEPLLDPKSIEKLLSAFQDDAVNMATLCCKGTDKDEYQNPNNVKLVKDANGDALYFSRSPIPFFRDGGDVSYFKHIGIYAYRRDFLLKMPELKSSFLEDSEKLEQLRVLENGYRIRAMEVDEVSIGVDTEEDLKRVEEIILRK